MIRFCLALLFILAINPNVSSQKLAVKSNILYALTATPNAALEIPVSKDLSLALSGGYNPWNREGSDSDNKKRVHWLVKPELRYWLGDVFDGHFLGFHGIFSRYNIAGYKIPLFLEKGSKDYRYDGYLFGAGFSYGYQWVFAKHWSVEATIGLGYLRQNYDKYQCVKCGDKLGNFDRNYWGPTQGGVTLIYLIR